MKGKFDLTAIRDFLILHGEKIAVGVVGLVFVWCLIRTVSTAGNTVDFSPEQLRADAQSAQQHIEQATPSPEVQPTDYVAIARRIRDKIDDTHYRHPVLWDPPLWERRGLRGEPPVFGLEKIRAVAGNGVFNMADPSAPPTSAAQAGMGTRGQRWVVVTGLIPIARQIEAYTETFKQALYRDPQRDYPLYLHYWVERAEVNPRAQGQLRWVRIDPRLMFFHFCRWWRGQSQEVVHPAFIPRVAPGGTPIVFPLGPRVGESWGPEVAFPPEIPLAAAMRGVPGTPGATGYRGEMAAYPGMTTYPGATYPGSPAYPGGAYPGMEETYMEPGYPGATMPYPGMTMTGSPGMPGMPGMSTAPGIPGVPGGPGAGIIPPLGELPGMPLPGQPTAPGQPSAVATGPTTPGSPGVGPTGPGRTVAGTTPRIEVKYQLFRFFDFTVEPGKQYVYRVQLVLFNPNYRLDPQYLERPELAEQPWLETQWSDPTDPVWVPMDARLVVGPVKPAPTVLHEPTASVVILAFRAEDGLRTYQDFTVFRGQLANLEGTIIRTGLRAGMSSPGASPYGSPGLDDLYMPPDATMAPGMPGAGARTGTIARTTAQKTEQEEKFVYKTEMLVVDMWGGERLHRTDASLTAPGELLVMDPNGTLLVIDELTHQAEYKLYHKEPEQPTRRPATSGPTAPEGYYPEMPEDYYMYGMMEYETGRGRTARGRGRTTRTPAGAGSPGMGSPGMGSPGRRSGP